MFCTSVLKQFHKISVIGLLAVVLGIIAIGPAMADKDSSEDHNKIDICHYDKDDSEYEKISVPEKKAYGHNNHANDIIPAPEDGCPDLVESENDSGSDSGTNMDEIMGDIKKLDNIIAVITNSQCDVGEVVTGFGPNGELLCSHDEKGESNSFNIISRTETIELASGKSITREYSCESGEIIVSGFIEIPPVGRPINNDGILVTSSEQSYVVVLNTNNNPDTVSVNVTYLCYDTKIGL